MSKTKKRVGRPSNRALYDSFEDRIEKKLERAMSNKFGAAFAKLEGDISLWRNEVLEMKSQYKELERQRARLANYLENYEAGRQAAVQSNFGNMNHRTREVLSTIMKNGTGL